MILCLKARESSPPPVLQTARNIQPANAQIEQAHASFETNNLSSHSLGLARPIQVTAGWSSPVARQAHNLKAAGSNPAPAPKQQYAPLTNSGAFAFGETLGTVVEPARDCVTSDRRENRHVAYVMELRHPEERQCVERRHKAFLDAAVTIKEL
jgi:hypothetical protein